MKKIFYAKPDQTYAQHLDHVFSAWRETVKHKQHFVERLAEKYGFSAERFWQGSLLSVAFHDIGKMTEVFQEMMDAIRETERFDWQRNYRHELASFNFAIAAWQIFNKKSPLSSVPVEAIAVVGHHKFLNMELAAFDRERRAGVPCFIKEGLEQAFAVAREIFEQEGLTLPELKAGLEKQNPYKLLGQIIGENGIFQKLLQRDDPERVRTLYILTKGILHYADWHGSGMATVNYAVRKSPDALTDDLAIRCRKRGRTFKGLRPFQEQMGNHSGHLIAVAPTGSGKTEGALLWALKNSQEMGGAKIICLLPTMVTANSIWSRFAEFFGDDNVGLTHSTAGIFIRNETGEDESDDWENRRNVLFDKTFIRPVTVATADQLLTTGFNAGRWVLKEINAANAVIILDEIHAYDGWTLGLIISAIRHFSGLGARFLLMSATMPTGLVNLFNEELKNARVIRDDTLLKKVRSTYFVEDRMIDDAEELIREAVKSGKRVLVVVNTVDHCQKLAQQFSRLSPECYHSRFTLKDRGLIEERIETAKFVIATQVVEVSLDIDYDWLFTECAPPDAIAQRAGRVNRYRDPKRDSRVYLFRAAGASQKIYNPINSPDILERAFQAFCDAPKEISEQNLIDIVDRVYHDIQIQNSESYEEAIGQYSRSQKQRMAIFDSRLDEDKQEVTRRQEYEKVSVIPLCFAEKVMGLPPKKRIEYEVKIPLWYAVCHKRTQKGIWFCDMKYDSNIGGVLEQEEQAATVQF